MKGTNFKSFITKKTAVIAGCVVLGIAAVSGGLVLKDYKDAIEFASSHVDPILETELVQEEAPLAEKPKVTKTTKKKTTTMKKTVKMKSASKKSYKKTLPTTTTKSSSTEQKNATTTVKTDTTVQTAVTEQYKKKSKNKTVTTKTTTTVTTTTTVVPTTTKTTSSSSSSSGSTVKATPTPAPARKGTYELNVNKAAPKMDSRVLNAFNTMGLKLIVNSSVSYSGYFSAKDKSITLRQEGDTVYHELGHFLAFIAGNYDTGKDFQKVYAAEKGKYSGYNRSYVTQNSSEYFAETVKDYILDPEALSKARPDSYKAVQTALSKVTTAQVTKMKLIMSVL